MKDRLLFAVEEELYELRRDPHCLSNLAGKQDVSALKTQLFDELRAQEDPRALGNAKVFDAYPSADVKMRGFYERYMAGENIRAGWVNESDVEKGVEQ